MSVNSRNNFGSIAVSFWLALVAIHAVVAPVAGMYDPKHGRWLQRDPLGVRPEALRARPTPLNQYTDGMNLYTYAKSNPSRFVDWLGMQATQPTQPPPPTQPAPPPDPGRPLPGPAPTPGPGGPGGTPIPGTGGTHQNCLGESLGIVQWLNWPHLGKNCSWKRWSDAQSFVPPGCSRVNCTGIDLNNTRCRAGEIELIVFLYRWGVPYGEIRYDPGFGGTPPHDPETGEVLMTELVYF